MLTWKKYRTFITIKVRQKGISKHSLTLKVFVSNHFSWLNNLFTSLEHLQWLGQITQYAANRWNTGIIQGPGSHLQEYGGWRPFSFPWLQYLGKMEVILSRPWKPFILSWPWKPLLTTNQVGHDDHASAAEPLYCLTLNCVHPKHVETSDSHESMYIIHHSFLLTRTCWG